MCNLWLILYTVNILHSPINYSLIKFFSWFFLSILSIAFVKSIDALDNLKDDVTLCNLLLNGLEYKFCWFSDILWKNKVVELLVVLLKIKAYCLDMAKVRWKYIFDCFGYFSRVNDLNVTKTLHGEYRFILLMFYT